MESKWWAMTPCERTLEAIQVLVLSAERLRGLSFCPDAAGALLKLACLATLRRSLGQERPAFVGFIGCTGTGKSTVFNSLAGRNISAIGWRAHNTRGPVLFVHDSFLTALNDVEQRFGCLLMPSFRREVTSAENPPFLTGSPEAMVLVAIKSEQENRASGSRILSNTAVAPQERPVLLDLPDINTTLAGEERLVALDLQPWLDTVIFIVDDETIYHRDYERPVALARELEQPRICILSNRGRDRVDLDHPDLRKAKTFFGVDAIHVLPEIKGEGRFEEEPEFLQLKEMLSTSVRHAPEPPILRRIAALARDIVEENRQRRSALDCIENNISVLINELLSREPPVPLEKILHDDVILVLRHLGLKRFAVSNIYHFLKRVAKTGSLKRNLQMAFGDKREEMLSHVLHLDPGKLVKEVSQRLSDHGETIVSAIRRNNNAKPILEKAPELRAMSSWREVLFNSSSREDRGETKSDGSLSESLRAIVEDFERRCHEMIGSDTLGASVKNDPLIAVTLVAALIADAFTLPGFGSWLIVPSVFKYMPLGKFEKAKRQFQRSVHDVIRRRLLRAVAQIREVRSRIVLEESDPLSSVLMNCAEYEDHEN